MNFFEEFYKSLRNFYKTKDKSKIYNYYGDF